MDDFKLFESVPHAITVVKNDAPVFTIVAVTDEFLLRTGLARQAFISKPFVKAFDTSTLLQPDAERIVGSFRRVVTAHNADEVLLSTPAQGGKDSQAQHHYTHVSNKPVYDTGGKVTHIIQTWLPGHQVPISQLRETLEMNMAKAADLFQQAPVAIAIVRGQDYILELANEGMLSFLGRTTDAIGKPLLEVLTEAKLQGLVDIFDYVRQSGENYTMLSFPATILINGVREKRFFDVTVQRYEQGGPGEDTRMFCVAHNVTEQVQMHKQVKEVQEKLSFRNALLEAINEATPDGILIVDTTNKVLLQNKRFAETWKIPVEILHSKDPNTSVEFANDLLADPELTLNGITAQQDQPDGRAHDVLLLKDGRVVERNGSPVLGEDGGAYGWAWYFRDVTDRVKQEQKFNNVVQQASMPIVIFKGEEMIVEVGNKALFDLWKADQSVIGKPFLEILPEMKEQGLMPLLLGVYRTGEPFSGSEVPIVFERAHNQKETLYFNFSYQPYREANGSITGVLAWGTDVTGQVMAKQQLEANEAELQRRVHERTLELDQINQALKRSNLSLEEFAYAASHDLKSPIRKINLLAQRLNHELAPSLTEAQHRIFKRMDESASRMLTLIDDLLSFSHISIGAGMFDEIDLCQKLQKVLEDLEIEVQEKKAQITFGELPVVWGNRRQLQQLFQNLISNALKYTKPGVTPKIHISSTTVTADDLSSVPPNVDANNTYHLIEVKDNGIGFDQVDAEQIFNVFTRLHTQTEYTGTGVGLSIVKRVVENHKGKVWAESTAGEGATFKILLPRNDHRIA